MYKSTGYCSSIAGGTGELCPSESKYKVTTVVMVLVHTTSEYNRVACLCMIDFHANYPTLLNEAIYPLAIIHNRILMLIIK